MEGRCPAVPLSNSMHQARRLLYANTLLFRSTVNFGRDPSIATLDPLHPTTDGMAITMPDASYILARQDSRH